MQKNRLLSYVLLGGILFFGSSALVVSADAGVVSEESQMQQVVGVESSRPVHIQAFVRDDCAHCAAEEDFLTQLQKERQDIRVTYYNLRDPIALEQFRAIAQKFGLTQGTPITLVGATIFQGFDTAETTGALMRQLVESSMRNVQIADLLSDTDTASVSSSLATGPVCTGAPGEKCETGGASVRIPFTTYVISLSALSLGSIALLLGLIDGFNPCAMWVLVMFLAILTQIGSRRKMIQVITIFLLAEAIMYYTILNVWLQAWDFVGLSRIVTPAVGILALGSGIYFLYKYWTWRAICAVASPEEQRSLQQRITALASGPLTYATIGSILFVAFSVNIFEFACSIGIPQTFTKILELNNMGFWGTQWYMLLYIVMYMIDDFIVFGLAVYGINKIGATMRYSQIATLIGGIAMLILGMLLLLAPQALVF